MNLENKMYTLDQAKEKSLKYFKGDNLAAEQWIRKYALKDSKGNLYESFPDQMHDRIANEIFRIEQKYKNPLTKEQIYSLIKDFKYLIPAGSNMFGIGNDNQVVSLSNCFVIGNKSDSYGGIMYTDQEQVQLMKRRGGVGHDLSHIRPKGSDVKNSALTSTGVVSFMERYSNSTKEVAQGGRRGALMLSLSVKHPDAKDFIDAKLEQGKVTGANISIKIDDDFMKAVKNNTPYTQQFPIDSENPEVTKKINARELWDKIITNAWKSAEPGVLFWDTIQKESIPDVYSEQGFKTTSTNPCGEIPLCPYDSCRLLALNLYSYVDNPFTKQAKFNKEKFGEHSHYALRIMDDIIDLEKEKINSILDKIKSDPEPEEIKRVEINLWEKILEKAEQGRRTGIGVTAEGDMLAALGIRYGSDEGIEFSEEVHKTLALNVYEESVNLAKERGAFKIYDAEKEKNNPFILRLKEANPQLYEEMVKYGRRNISMLTIAPTGTVSIMAQTTSGIEPLFSITYNRNVKVEENDKNTKVSFEDKEGIKWHTYPVFHKGFEDWLIANGKDVNILKDKTPEEAKEIIEELVKQSPYYKATSKDVDWVKKVEMQGRIQKWVDHSISSTTNMPKGTPKEVVGDVYMKAWKAGCKGMTVYVDGSRGKGVLGSGEKDLEKIVFSNVELNSVNIKEGDDAAYYNIKKGEDTYHLAIVGEFWEDPKTKKVFAIPTKIFQNTKPLGTEESIEFGQSGLDRTGRLKSLDPDYAEMIKEWKSVTGNRSFGFGPNKINSPSHGVGLSFEHYCLSRGIVGYDVNNGLVNTIKKSELVRVTDKEKIKKLKKQMRNSNGKDLKQKINENTGEKLICPNCGNRDPTKFHREDGCPDPICDVCNWSAGTCS